MAQNRPTGTVVTGGDRPGPSRGGSEKAGSRLEGGVHFVPNDARRFPICGSWRSNWNHTGDADRATCPACRARLAARPVQPSGAGQNSRRADAVSVVRMDTGLIALFTNDTLTSDLPADIAEHATEASLDEVGHLHYLGGDGCAHVCQATTRTLGNRAPSDACLLPANTAQSERTGWSLLEVCVLEPRPAGE